MVDTLSQHGMSHLCDVVPNHMAIMGEDNVWWMDVLENGPSSHCAEFFDIDWAPQDADLAGKVLVAVLAEPYAAVLERGELRLEFESRTGSFAIRYVEHRFPLDPRAFPRVLVAALARARDALDTEVAAEVERLISRLVEMPARTDLAPERVAERRRASGESKKQLAVLAATHQPLASAIAEVVECINGTPGDPASFEALHELLEAQAFRLAYWRVASDEINYRRFFDVNELAGLRTENEAVFDATHGFILDLAARAAVGGLRIDHPDGLYDPARYFGRLQERFRDHSARHRSTEDDSLGLYVVLEKIDAPHDIFRRTGRFTVPPATVSPTWSMGCSSIPWPGRASIASGARSSATRRTRSSSRPIAAGARSSKVRWRPIWRR
jgi:(1->4)-alpha-D-glucan 1-alpha-D-glucosylmutase